MKTIRNIGLVILTLSFFSCKQGSSAADTNSQNKNTQTMDSPKVNKTDAEWKASLTPEQYEVLRNKGTERPGTGEFNDHYKKGMYTCAACGAELFSSDQKFNSHCGWPSFDGEVGGGDKVKKVKDFSHGMIRTEIICANCGGHLGHLFDDGPTASGQRYCVNSLSLAFKPAADSTEKK